MPKFESRRVLNVGRVRAFLDIAIGLNDNTATHDKDSVRRKPTSNSRTKQNEITEKGPGHKKGPGHNPHRLPDPDPKADRIAIFKRLLSRMQPGTLLDLGAGHGKFSMAANELGWQVTAVDARTTRMPMTEGIEWIESDVRDFDPSGYDCICILGLLYHLTVEDQLELLRKCAGALTIVDTHVGDSAREKKHGYEGKLFEEVPGGTAEARDATPTASWGNEVSFWPTQESLLKMALDAGFSQTAVILPPHTPNRTFYVFYP